jgi:hypothetical protein
MYSTNGISWLGWSGRAELHSQHHKKNNKCYFLYPPLTEDVQLSNMSQVIKLFINSLPFKDVKNLEDEQDPPPYLHVRQLVSCGNLYNLKEQRLELRPAKSLPGTLTIFHGPQFSTRSVGR